MSVSSSEDSTSEKRNKSKKTSKKSGRKHKHERRSSSRDSSDSSSTQRRKRKEKKAKKKAKKQKRSKASPVNKVTSSSSLSSTALSLPSSSFTERLRLLAEPETGPDLALAAIPETVKRRPMTKEDWDKHQSTLRKEYHAESGRTRLVRGDGEIMEEMVTKDMHTAINKAATKADGAYYQTVLGLKRNK